jgi:hypothetical protein
MLVCLVASSCRLRRICSTHVSFVRLDFSLCASVFMRSFSLIRPGEFFILSRNAWARTPAQGVRRRAALALPGCGSKPVWKDARASVCVYERRFLCVLGRHQPPCSRSPGRRNVLESARHFFRRPTNKWLVLLNEQQPTLTAYCLKALPAAHTRRRHHVHRRQAALWSGDIRSHWGEPGPAFHTAQKLAGCPR